MPKGRPQGSLNKNKQALLVELRKHFPDYHPVVELAKIGNDPEVEQALRVQCHKEVAQYVTPKLKAVEIQAEGQFDAVIRWGDPHTLQSEATPGDSS